MSAVLGEYGLFEFPKCWELVGGEQIELLGSSALGNSVMVMCKPIQWKKSMSEVKPLEITLQLKPPFRLLGFRVHSNARFLELYQSSPDIAGGQSQYLSTSRGSSISGSTNGILYSHEHDLPQPLPTNAKIQVKLVSMRQPDQDKHVANWDKLQLMFDAEDTSLLPQNPTFNAPVQSVHASNEEGLKNDNMLTNTTLADNAKMLHESQTAVQAMKASLRKASQDAASAQQSEFNVLTQALTQLAMPNSPLQSILTQIQKSFMNDMMGQMEKQMVPVLQRLDRLENQISNLTAVTEVVQRTQQQQQQAQQELQNMQNEQFEFLKTKATEDNLKSLQLQMELMTLASKKDDNKINMEVSCETSEMSNQTDILESQPTQSNSNSTESTQTTPLPVCVDAAVQQIPQTEVLSTAVNTTATESVDKCTSTDAPAKAADSVQQISESEVLPTAVSTTGTESASKCTSTDASTKIIDPAKDNSGSYDLCEWTDLS